MRRRPSDEALVTPRGKLEGLPVRSPERQRLMLGCADMHGISIATVYRALREPVGEAIVDSVLSKQIDDLEPTCSEPQSSAGGCPH